MFVDPSSFRIDFSSMDKADLVTRRDYLQAVVVAAAAVAVVEEKVVGVQHFVDAYSHFAERRTVSAAAGGGFEGGVGGALACDDPCDDYPYLGTYPKVGYPYLNLELPRGLRQPLVIYSWRTPPVFGDHWALHCSPFVNLSDYPAYTLDFHPSVVVEPHNKQDFSCPFYHREET